MSQDEGEGGNGRWVITQKENGETNRKVLGGSAETARRLSEMTNTFSTSAFVTLMSASIFSKYCCALSASLQSLSNFLLH